MVQVWWQYKVNALERRTLTPWAAGCHITIMSEIRKICVYCGSGAGIDPVYTSAARILGRSLAEAGVGLVYGGGNIGLMGETARTVLKHGGHVTGIIPEFLMQKERMLDEVQELIITKNMHERKMAMFDKADAFVALPGGIGTLEELVEMSTWRQLGRHTMPIVLANIAGFWQPLLELLEHMRAQEFIRSGLEVHMDVVNRAEDIVPTAIERAAST
jgi:uncharacterized protein (TIGR00730 family)